MPFITLTTSSGNFVQADADQNGKLIATNEEPQLFDLTVLNDEQIALKAFSMEGLYVSIANAELVANKETIGIGETFKLIPLSNDTLALQTVSTGHYLHASQGERTIMLSETGISSQETFEITHYDQLEEAALSLQNCCGCSHGHEDENGFIWEEETHRKMVETSIALLKPYNASKDVRLFLQFAQESDFMKSLYQGLVDADKKWKLKYTGFLYCYHFYDPDTGKNFLGGKRTALTEGTRYFGTAKKCAKIILLKLKKGEMVTQKEWENCGYQLGLASHYLTDLIQPMHAANFANIFPTFHWRDWRHSTFEDKAEEIIKADYLKLKDLSPFDCKDLNTEYFKGAEYFLKKVATDSKAIFTNKVKKIADSKIKGRGIRRKFDLWTDDEVRSILDLTIKPTGLLRIAQFYLLWIRLAQSESTPF